MAYQSLYRRFRPQRFSEVRGQDHLVAALQNALRDGRVGHAYLFSGPRGTGKTTSARILAKALNCTNLAADGEPCCVCEACTAVERGTSMDLVELDAASNNGVDSIRELVASASLGSPGLRKVYILDEVHMLSTAASNALLKTLEEPPSHVVFVLATTDPQKVLPTIRSRTQHVELSLIGATEMAEHVRDIASRAEIDVTDEIVDYVVRRGGGSARDTLSALDQVVAAGGIATERVPVDDLVEALIARNPAAALTAVAAAVSAGAEARELVEKLTRHLRDLFLVQQHAPPPELPEASLTVLADQGKRLGAASTVRALETLGGALVDARQASDPRLVVEVALVKITSGPASIDIDALMARIERLEAQLAGAPVPTPAAGVVGSSPPPPPPPTAPAAPVASRPAGAAPPPPPAPRSGRTGRVSAARAALHQATSGQPSSSSQPAAPPVAAPAPGPAPGPTPAPAPAPAVVTAGGSAPSITQLRDEWADSLASAPPIARALLGSCEIDSPTPGQVICHLPNAMTADKCRAHVPTIEAVLTARYRVPMTVELLADGSSGPVPGAASAPRRRAANDEPEEAVDMDDLTDAPAAGASGVERLTAAFPGAKIVDDSFSEY